MTEKKAAMVLTLQLPKMSSFRLTATQIREFIRLLEERATTNPLYSLADRAQAITAIQTMEILNGLYDSLQEKGLEGDLDDVQKLVNLIVKSTSGINATFKQLAISSESREEEVDTDPLSRMLRDLNLEHYVPPTLKESFLKAKNDIKAIEKGEIYGENQTKEEKKQMLEDIKKPIKSWVETEIDTGKEEVVDLESGGTDAI